MSGAIPGFQILPKTNCPTGETAAAARKLALTGAGQFRSNMRKINPFTCSGGCAAPLKIGDGN
jgi:hypothetical protein